MVSKQRRLRLTRVNVAFPGCPCRLMLSRHSICLEAASGDAYLRAALHQICVVVREACWRFGRCIGLAY